MPRRTLTGITVGLVAVVMIIGTLVRTQISHQIYQVTGEANAFQQAKALSDLAVDALRPPLNTADRVQVNFSDVPRLGVNVFLEQEVEPEKRRRTVEMAAQAGFHFLRQEFPWEDIEIHDKGDFQDRRNQPYRSAWDKYDNIVSLAEQYHMELIVRLSKAPSWTHANPDTKDPYQNYGPPDNFSDFGDFVAAVVARYKGRVRFYQIWNEPNIFPEWGNQPVSPSQYTELLKIGYRRAKQADPNAVIIAGALASTIENDAHNFNDFAFLQQMYDAGAAPYFDIAAMQDYGLWSGATDRRMQPRVLNYSRPQFIRDLMVKNGDAAKPIWISEMGWNALPDGNPAPPSFGKVTLEQQARFTVEALQRSRQEWPWIGVINIWFMKRASDAEKNQAFYYFRLLEPDFTPLPVYDAITTYTHSDAARSESTFARAGNGPLSSLNIPP